MVKHLYCIINHDGGDLKVPAGGAHLVPYRDVALVVKEMPLLDYASLPRDVLVQHLARHQSMIEEIVKERTAIPIKFGTSVGNDQELREILESGYPSFRQAIDRMAGKVEIDLIALWNDLDSALKEIGQREEIRRFKDCIVAVDQEELQEQAVELGRMLRSALVVENRKVKDEILDFLKGQVLEQRLHEHFDDRMLLNAAFLVRSDGKKELEERIDALDEKYSGRIDFRIIGPLPYHSFSTLEIKRITAGEIAEAMRIMGVKPGADGGEVKGAYRKLLRKYHPDKNPDNPDAQKNFEQFNQAYKILANCNEISCAKDAVTVRVI